MNLDPQPTPKMGNYERCTNCGRCVLGCPQGVKWDTRQFLQSALEKGAQIITHCKVERVVIENGKATGVKAKKGWSHQFYPAELVILAAGGLRTPVILQNSGIACEQRLFVDSVLCVATEWKDCLQNREVSMPFIVQKEHFIISPYFDYLSFFFHKDWKLPARNLLGIMIKLADVPVGSITEKSLQKRLTDEDRQRLADGVDICTEILTQLGAKKGMFQKPRLSNAVSHRVFPMTVGHTHPVICRTTGGYLKHAQKRITFF